MEGSLVGTGGRWDSGSGLEREKNELPSTVVAPFCLISYILFISDAKINDFPTPYSILCDPSH